ncbi:3-hydroxyacyl-ACP dehydratase FabZ family protein [Lactiplantibacillus mudanjiangensis]|uniref:(3R)-hydroxymyristoyl-(Acyl carrier protein) dehydratase [Lactobacillus plantarum JDM1] n=1 Tax=Lactiplantibacillus mudanjiangensis TaxID=1296538 RepID=A0A660E5T0_9LACO|nr:3-hydroxyacyl-ACP dehydratase FabZ family protein [Lactiplantibacillus mudanjiangensis]VDG20678.1 (3R)-hydroxymyristoyl-(acyl carrier protein) dehydratase [Lactobacillus plantarum JDM1] [Lactiplantibacillus mudanjiangensis]VDG24178.1 (3R)-hydroxymyristoyl-(acyl carrier protein) dehydratase [Lactobacillus plantarum JDM1] [Lactiplantibacillus mudanjiangensis]VDG30159.1 (3R)-hydroxymyristoyl-(acyl carrier protein) dehydratase [Lactobacillus plantarum JDM1] [Lactiplantibacillus mudanjiangensis]V
MATVQDLIPQRYPFQLLDRLIDVTPGVQAQAEKLVTINEWFFQSETLTGRTMLRPLLLEILAQTGVAALLSMPDNQGKNVFFGGIQQATFQASVQPGDRLQTMVTLTKLKHRIGMGHGVIRCEGQVVVTADLIFVIQP